MWNSGCWATDWRAGWTGVFLSHYCLLFPLLLSCLSWQRIQVSKKKGPSLEFGLVSILLFSSAGLISFWHVRRPPIYWPFYTFIPIHCVYSFSCRGMIFLCFTVNLEPAMDSKLLCFLFNSIQLTFHVQVHVHPLIHNLNLHVAHWAHLLNCWCNNEEKMWKMLMEIAFWKGELRCANKYLLRCEIPMKYFDSSWYSHSSLS